MNKSMRLGLKAGERLYVNGAVLRVDRKVNIELLNDVKFLLEAHVLQPEDTTTPLRQLYFTIQMMLMDADDAQSTELMFQVLLATLQKTFENETILTGLKKVERQVAKARLFDALKTLRALFIEEELIVGKTKVMIEGELSEPRSFAAA